MLDASWILSAVEHTPDVDALIFNLVIDGIGKPLGQGSKIAEEFLIYSGMNHHQGINI